MHYYMLPIVSVKIKTILNGRISQMGFPSKYFG